MKKLYLNVSKYLFNFNAEGGAGAGGSDAGSQAGAGAGGEGGAPPAGGAGGEGGVAQPTWLDSLPKEVREHERLKGFKTPEEVIKAIINAPVPEAIPEKYTLPQGVPEKLGEWAKAQNLTQKQLDSVLQQHEAVIQGQLKERVAAQKAGCEQLFTSWGDQKEANLQLANRVLALADPDGKLGVVKYITSAESGYAMMNPIVVQMFHNIGAKLKESGFLKSDIPSSAGASKEKVNPAYEMYPYLAPGAKKQ